MGAARSTGIFNSTGGYITFCDADDWYEENYISEHIKHIKKYNADISLCKTQVIFGNEPNNCNYNDEVEILEGDLVSQYVTFSGISVSLYDKVFKRECIMQPELMNSFRFSEDLFMNFVACKYAK